MCRHLGQECQIAKCNIDNRQQARYVLQLAALLCETASEAMTTASSMFMTIDQNMIRLYCHTSEFIELSVTVATNSNQFIINIGLS